MPEAWPDRLHKTGATVVLEGSGSFVNADLAPPTWPAPPGPARDLFSDHLPRRSERWFVVADSRGRVDWNFTGDESTALHVLVCRATPPGYLQRLRDLQVGYFVVGERQVDLRRGLARIGEVFGARTVVANSGGTLNAGLLRQGLVDILDVVTLPGLVGGAGAPSLMDGPELGVLEHPIALQLIDRSVEHGAVRSRYRVVASRRDSAIDAARPSN